MVLKLSKAKVYVQHRGRSVLSVQACNEILSTQQNHEIERGQTAVQMDVLYQPLVTDATLALTEQWLTLKGRNTQRKTCPSATQFIKKSILYVLWLHPGHNSSKYLSKGGSLLDHY
jgi:hypothetical protein